MRPWRGLSLELLTVKLIKEYTLKKKMNVVFSQKSEIKIKEANNIFAIYIYCTKDQNNLSKRSQFLSSTFQFK